jgi:hypothetical protein
MNYSPLLSIDENELIKSFFTQKDSIQNMKNLISIENKKLTEINLQIKSMLQGRENKTIKIDNYGNQRIAASLLLCTNNRREYLSKLTLESLLEKFFIDKFSDRQSLEDIQNISKEASSFVWNNRALIENTVVKTNFPRKRKSSQENT